MLRRDNGLAFECVSVGLRTQQHHLNLIDARKEMYAALTVYLESEGTNYVQGHFHNAYAVNCPEGRSTQPIDLWYCKLSEAACSLQAKVFLDSREAFIAGCTAPTSRKRTLLNSHLVTEHPKGATDDRDKGATQSGSFSLLDGVNYWSFFALFSSVVFVPWGQFFGER